MAGALAGSARAQGQIAPDLDAFRTTIAPILDSSCAGCHGEERQRGGLRLDELDPNLFEGDDVDLWVDVLSALSNGEMPPEGEAQITGEDRGRVIEWLSAEIQGASRARRSSVRHPSLRRMTRYEYEYVLQDLFGAPFPFASDLPPDPESEDGFQNSSEALRLNPRQFRAYLDAGRKALQAVTVRGEEPAPLVWSVSMDAAAAFEWKKLDEQRAGIEKKHEGDAEARAKELAQFDERLARRPGGAHYEDLVAVRFARQTWVYYDAKYAWAPEAAGARDLNAPLEAGASTHVAVIPKGHGLIVELGERIPEHGDLRVRVLASRAEAPGGDGPAPSLRLDFGWQASNDSSAVVPASDLEHEVAALPGAPETYEFRVPLPTVTLRNWMRETATMGGLPSPSEYIKLVNTSRSGGPLRVHHVEVVAPFYEAWPPASHLRVFPGGEAIGDEDAHARAILASFLPRALRREVTESEIDRKVALFARLRGDAGSFDDAMIEVLATVLASPQFLFVGHDGQVDGDGARAALFGSALATRLSMFLWCSAPDEELLALARSGALEDSAVLEAQTARLLGDPRSERFSKEFVRQWLGLALLDYLHVDQKAYPAFDPALKKAMEQEPVAFFREVLARDESVLAFVDADFTMANERLAEHYGLDPVFGNAFRRVDLGEDSDRGGLLTQAGLLAMNSDGKDSHPLKRGVWVLESLLGDPPPPPPPAVPEIDLADPRIAQMTLKERIEDHRNHPACISCHAKIDPWGIAFENYDAVGAFRDEIGGEPVDATSTLFNGQQLDGMEGLKGFLLDQRQDQFVRALVHNLATYALGRPLTFEDRAAVDQITESVRAKGDGLATIISAIVSSDLFRS